LNTALNRVEKSTTEPRFALTRSISGRAAPLFSHRDSELGGGHHRRLATNDADFSRAVFISTMIGLSTEPALYHVRVRGMGQCGGANVQTRFFAA
jgi:hypothetical protein